VGEAVRFRNIDEQRDVDEIEIEVHWRLEFPNGRLWPVLLLPSGVYAKTWRAVRIKVRRETTHPKVARKIAQARQDAACLPVRHS
jgi:hypothetical protein